MSDLPSQGMLVLYGELSHTASSIAQFLIKENPSDKGTRGVQVGSRPHSLIGL